MSEQQGPTVNGIQLPPVAVMLDSMSRVFEVFGRALVCFDRSFSSVHASESLDTVVGEGASGAAVGLEAAQLFGPELFGEGSSFRRALEQGKRREGWGATLRVPGFAPRHISLTVATLHHKRPNVCDPRVMYLVLIRPADEDRAELGEAPSLFSGMVARSAAMRHIFELIEKLDESEATVLISGESGTGKELVARAIHEHSPRQTGRFVAVNCGAIPGELLESELFGHVRGAFTGAVRDRVGRFELAQGGTLFLDEVGELPLSLQVKLLRVLQEHAYERVGESSTRRSDTRIIAASNRNLKAEVLDGRFREDLYYRLRVVPIQLPPLRDRREDIAPLAQHLLERIQTRQGRSLLLAPDTLRLLLSYPWPGNVRELENALEYAVAVCQRQTLLPGDLPPELLAATDPAVEPSRRAEPSARPAPGATPDDGGERERLLAALEAHRWRRDEAARQLGISRTTLWRKMREYGLL